MDAITPTAPGLKGRVMMNQDWRDLTMLHWAVPPGRVAHLMPPGVHPDTIEGVTYVGLVPFRMVDAAPLGGRGTPGQWGKLGTFLETNVRLYSVDEHGTRGIVFLSLDCDRLVVVAGARLAFAVPYRWALMTHGRRVSSSGVEHRYAARLLRPGSPITSKIAVRVGSERAPTELDHFVSARWGLHTQWPPLAGPTLYIPNQHEPWPLRDVELLELDDHLMASVGLPELADRPPDQLAFSPGVHTEFGWPRPSSDPDQPARR
jgi:uncharacterized protein